MYKKITTTLVASLMMLASSAFTQADYYDNARNFRVYRNLGVHATPHTHDPMVMRDYYTLMEMEAYLSETKESLERIINDTSTDYYRDTNNRASLNYNVMRIVADEVSYLFHQLKMRNQNSVDANELLRFYNDSIVTLELEEIHTSQVEHLLEINKTLLDQLSENIEGFKYHFDIDDHSVVVD